MMYLQNSRPSTYILNKNKIELSAYVGPDYGTFDALKCADLYQSFWGQEGPSFFGKEKSRK